MLFKVFYVVSLALIASAQSLSAGCTNALAAIATNPGAAACLSPSSLIPIATAGNTSVVEPINNWLTSLCAAPSCSNATLSAIVTNATAGCAAEFSFQASPKLVSGIANIVQQYYPTVRKVLCLKDSNTNCITQTLTNIQNIVGPLTLSNIVSFAGPNIQNIPTNITCTNCIKAAYNVIKETAPSLVSDAESAAQSQCGVSFTDGSTPSGISQSATDATHAPSSALGAGSLLTHGHLVGVGISSLVAVFAGLTFLG